MTELEALSGYSTPKTHERARTTPTIIYKKHSLGNRSNNGSYGYIRSESSGFISSTLIVSAEDPMQIYKDNLTKRQRLDSFDIPPDINLKNALKPELCRIFMNYS